MKNLLISYALGGIVGLLILLACWSADGAPLPPWPVKRPAPLLSPKAASVMRSQPMTKFAPVSSSYVGTMTVALTRDINILFCNTNDSHCMLYDRTDVATIQKAGYELSLYVRDTVTGASDLVATFIAASFDRESGFTWFQPSNQRPVTRFFVERQTIITPTSFAPAAVGIVVAPKFSKQVTPWTRRRT